MPFNGHALSSLNGVNFKCNISLFQNIPKELRDIPQWIVWKLVPIESSHQGAKKPTKVPYQATNGRKADVTNQSHYDSFDVCVDACKNGDYSGVGFCFTDSDPYSFLDLDHTQDDHCAARQLKIFEAFNSYSELSPSGKGLHIIVRGKVPEGRRRDSVEIYSNARYATFTGNVYNAHNKIEERQTLLTSLWKELNNNQNDAIIIEPHFKDEPSFKEESHFKETDDEIIRRASTALNADKFNLLNEGKWQELYPSQSEADFAFIDILAFYTQNQDQLIRLFQRSILGRRDKAKRKDYVTKMIKRSFDRQLPPVNIDDFKNAIEDKLVNKDKLIATHNFDVSSNLDVSSNISTIPLPPGLMGELAQFIYDAAPRPVKELAIAGAIGLMSGICGRAYNISGTGLNQYIIVLANTGSGKEGIASTIDKLLKQIQIRIPTINNFIGPAEIASGQALIKYLHTNSCFISILGEFGFRLQQMSNPFAISSEKMLLRVMLDLYNKSGHHQIFRPSIYSDKDKNIGATQAPSFTLLAESTPETFYNVLNEDMISAGLLPRFMIIEYKGKVPYLNNAHTYVEPSSQLITSFSDLAANCETIMYTKRVTNVSYSPEAFRMLDDFQKFATDRINNADREVSRQLWNRAHMKMLKISSLIAIGVNMSEPVIIPEYIEWCYNLINRDIKNMSERFEAGKIGISGEITQLDEIIKAIKDYINKPWSYLLKYVKTDYAEQLHRDKIVPYSYINKRMAAMSSFRHDKQGATQAIKRCIQVLLDSDKLREVPKADLQFKYNTSQRSFVINSSLLDD